MALLTLKDIGKIYVSEGSVAVGIRGVNLSFERGEFVAITGKSGSGKSTLLNVISGMDSYEEGELYIEGQTTSHYLQPEWEEYREKYISFIFQDYNIIESFTVLQNVELALMHIEDKKERRRRALELITRVGLSSHIKQKGSKLSGGQKQRTVIARALAKDSPIILADEPTGNLDSATSDEIIELLREVSKNKLLIVVTHNFEQVEKCATRHIRIFDGAVESDHTITPPSQIDGEKCEEIKKEKKSSKLSHVKKGAVLGRSIFTSKPKLSTFLCLLMIIGTLGIFLMTSLMGSFAEMFERNYMFEPIDGRVVITKQNGEVITVEEIDMLARSSGAEGYLPYDMLLDRYTSLMIPEANRSLRWLNCKSTYGESFGDDIIGSYPTAENEVFLYLPISYKPVFGETALKCDRIEWNGQTILKVTGVKYYYDNNQTPKCLFTDKGFRTATAIYCLGNMGNFQVSVQVYDKKGNSQSSNEYYGFVTSFDMEAGKMYIPPDLLGEYSKKGSEATLKIEVSSKFYNYNYNYYDSSKEISFLKSFDESVLTKDRPSAELTYMGGIVISSELVKQMGEELLSSSYKQASLFFENQKEAEAMSTALQKAGYIAVPSNTTYTPDASTTLSLIVSSVAMAVVWVLAIIFLAFFINLCSTRSLSAFKGDMAIMRSMGIQVKVIRIGMYVRMLLSLIPAFLAVVTVGILIFTNPKFNQYFVYLYAWQYAVIFLGMILLTVRITHKQIRKLFRESVKKSLRGGSVE